MNESVNKAYLEKREKKDILSVNTFFDAVFRLPSYQRMLATNDKDIVLNFARNVRVWDFANKNAFVIHSFVWEIFCMQILQIHRKLSVLVSLSEAVIGRLAGRGCHFKTLVFV